jgi:hypothetical protein
VEQLRHDYDYEEEEEGNSINRDPVDADDRPMFSYDEIEYLYRVSSKKVSSNWMSHSQNVKKERSPNEQCHFQTSIIFFKGLVGTKVANKWKRNRCEL